MYKVNADFINEQKISEILEANKKPDPKKVSEVLSKAREMKGLNMADVAVLTGITSPSQLQELF